MKARAFSCACLIMLNVLGGCEKHTACFGQQAAQRSSALNGIWLADRVDTAAGSALSATRESEFEVIDRTFQITHFCGSSKTLTGDFTLDDQHPLNIDLHVDAIDLSDVWPGVRYPQCTLPGIYKISDGRLTVCFPIGMDPHRPTKFEVMRNGTYIISVTRAARNFTGFPRTVIVDVRDSAGHSIAGAELFTYVQFSEQHGTTPITPLYHYNDVAWTNAEGYATVKYTDLAGAPLGARYPRGQLIGYVITSPALVESGRVTIALTRECHIDGKIECPELRRTGQEIGWTNVYLSYEGQRIGEYASSSGRFAATVPPGDYEVEAYGKQVRLRRIDVTIPVGRRTFTLPPILLNPTRISLVMGHQVPELERVMHFFADLSL
jgi:uncharacterized protein (TIGR03067 family)